VMLSNPYWMKKTLPTMNKWLSSWLRRRRRPGRMLRRLRLKRRKRRKKGRPLKRPKELLLWMTWAKFYMEVILLKRGFLSESKKMFSKLKDWPKHRKMNYSKQWDTHTCTTTSFWIWARTPFSLQPKTMWCKA
jgi:hypothetical protein